MINDAGRLIERLPTALPGEIADVCVFEIKRREQFVEATEFEKLAAVERAGSTAAVEARKEAGRSPGLRDDPRAALHPATILR